LKRKKEEELLKQKAQGKKKQPPASGLKGALQSLTTTLKKLAKNLGLIK